MIQLPPFYNENPILWFEQVESIFAVEKIESSCDKYLHFVGSVNAHILKHVIHIIEKKPTPPTAYEDMKKKIIGDFKALGKRRFANLFSGQLFVNMKLFQDTKNYDFILYFRCR